MIEATLKAFVITLAIAGCAIAVTSIFEGASSTLAEIAPETVTIEGHDYFKLPGYGLNYTLTHKGNCRACERIKNTPPK